jgi:hypothetical protein
VFVESRQERKFYLQINREAADCRCAINFICGVAGDTLYFIVVYFCVRTSY